MSTYNIYIDYGSGWIDITSYVLDGSLAKTETLFDKEAKATINTATFDLQMTTSIAQMLLGLSNSAAVKVRIYKNSSYWFTGYMRPVTEFTVSNSEKIIKIECIDTSWLLSQRKLASTILRMPSDNMVVCRSGGGSTSLVHVLLNAAGWDWGYNVPDILDSVAYYKADKESQTIFDLLCDLLYGFHRNFYIDEEGKFRVYDWGPSSITSAGIFNSSNIIKELKVERDDTEYDSVVAKWYQTTALSNQMVVNSDPLYGVVTLENFGDKFPPGGAEWWDWGAENTDKKQVIGVSNATARYFIHSVRYRRGWTPYNVWATGNYTIGGSAPRLYLSFPVQHDYEKLRTKFQIWTGTGVDTRVCSFQVFADLIYRIKMADVYYPASGRSNTKELKIDTLYSEAAANALVGAVYKRITIGSRKYRFKSLESAGVGGYYTVQNAILNVSQVVRIVEKNTSIYNGQEIYEYYAEGAEAAGSVVTEIAPGVFIPGLPPAAIANIITLSQSGSLLPSGFLTKPVFGSLLENIEDIGRSGLFFTRDYLGFYKWDEGSGTGTWNVRIKSDGTFKFLGDSDNYIEWDGAALLIQGTARSANYVQGSSGWRITVDGNAEFNNVTIRGTIYANEGKIGGWIISTDLLKSAASGARIELNQNKKRISVFDAYNETVAMGYLEGLPKRDGSGYWGAGDYGFWAKQGDRLRIDGDVEYIKGDWLIQNDASYLIKNFQDRVIVRIGTDTGEKGFYLYDPATSTLQIRLGTKGAERGLYVLENNTGLNYRAKLDTSGFFVGDDLNYVWYDRASSSLTMKVTSFLVSSLGTEIKGSVQISDEGTLGGGLVNPLKVYTSGSGSAKIGIIEQPNRLRVKIGSSEVLSTSSSGIEIKGSIQLSDEGALGGGLTNPLKLHTSGSGSSKVGIVEQYKEIAFKVGNQTAIRAIYDPTAGSVDVLAFGREGRGHEGDDRSHYLYVGTYPLKNFSWDGYSAHYYWTKVGTLGAGIAFLLLEVYLTSDVNYPRSAKFYVHVSSFSPNGDSGSIEVEEVFNTTATGPDVRVCVDTSRNIWVWQSATWDSFAYYKIIRDYNVSLTKNANTWQEATPNGVVVGVGEAKRFIIPSKTVTHVYDVITRKGAISLGASDSAGYRLRVNGPVLVDQYVRTRRFWELYIDAYTVGYTYAYRCNEDGSHTQLYFGNGKTGSYFIAALNAILADMGKPTSGICNIPASGGIRDMSVAWVRRFGTDRAYLWGKMVNSATYSYIVANGDSTAWDGTLVFWT